MITETYILTDRVTIPDDAKGRVFCYEQIKELVEYVCQYISGEEDKYITIKPTKELLDKFVTAGYLSESDGEYELLALSWELRIKKNVSVDFLMAPDLFSTYSTTVLSSHEFLIWLLQNLLSEYKNNSEGKTLLVPMHYLEYINKQGDF